MNVYQQAANVLWATFFSLLFFYCLWQSRNIK